MSKAEAVQFLKQYLRNEKDISVNEDRLAFTYQRKVIDKVFQTGLGLSGYGTVKTHQVYHFEDFRVNIAYAKVAAVRKYSFDNKEYLDVIDNKGANLSGGFEWDRIDDRFVSALLALCPNVEAGSAAADPSNEIYLAITEGDLAKLAAMLDRSPELVGFNTDYGTPLYIAAEKGKKEAAALLIAKGAKVDERTRKMGGEFTALYVAAEKGNRHVAELLIAKGADVNAGNTRGFTPLHMAALNDRVDVAGLLIAKGAQVSIASITGYTPLHSAAEKGRMGAARLLIARQADVNYKTRDGWTPLHVAAESGSRDMVELLIAAGAAVNAKTKYDYTPLHISAAHNRREAAVIKPVASACV